MSVRWISAWFSKCIIQSWSSLYSFVAVCSSFANRFCLKKKVFYIWTLAERLISRWALNASQWQLYSGILWVCTLVICNSEWVTVAFTQHVLEYPPKWLQRCLVVIWLVSHETADVLTQVLCTPYNHAPCHFILSHIRKVHGCLAVTCHLHLWQNDRFFYVLLRS